MGNKQNKLRLLIWRARTAKKLTQHELAALSGVSRTTIARIELGQGASVDSIRDLAHVLEISMPELAEALFI